MHGIDLEKPMREETRWRLLRALDAGRPGKVSETILYRTLYEVELPLSPKGLRRELDYLRDKNLIIITGEDDPVWLAELTADGVDVVEYTVPAPAGISRPKRYW